MTSVDLRKRLLSLKHITEDLRQSTTTPALNLQHIRTLITDLKQLSEHPQPPSRQPSPSSPSQTLSEGSEEPPPFTYTNLFRPLPVPSPREQLAQEKEVISLRDENLHLEERLLLMKEELARREPPREGKEEPKEKELPFFRHTDSLQLFVCRFEISEGDYQKIEYGAGRVELQLDKLVLTHREKATVEEFDLTTLQNVVYLGGNTVLYRLQEFLQQEPLPVSLSSPKESALTNLFVRYESSEQFRKWDLSIFSNYQLSSSLQETRVFKSHFRRVRAEEGATRDERFMATIKDSQDLTLLQQKELLQFYLRKKEEYVQIKNIVQEKIPLKHTQPQPQPQEAPPQSILSSPSEAIVKSILEPEQPLPKEIPETQPTVLEPELPPIPPKPEVVEVQRPEQPVPKELRESEEVRERNFSFSKEVDKILPNRSSNPGILPKPVMNDQQLWHSQPYAQGFFPGNQPQERSPLSQSNQLTPLKVVQNKVSTARKNLQHGYEATKYSKDGVFFHEKRVFLSLDCKKLCWCEKDRESDYKSIPLEVITKVDYGAVGEGIRKHVKSPNPGDYCVVEYFAGDYKKKTIELGSTGVEMRRLAEELQTIMNYSKGTSLNALVES